MEVHARQVFRLFGPPSRSLPVIEAAAVSVVTVPNTRNSGVAYERFGGVGGGWFESRVMRAVRSSRAQLTATTRSGQRASTSSDRGAVAPRVRSSYVAACRRAAASITSSASEFWFAITRSSFAYLERAHTIHSQMQSLRTRRTPR
jgi:hypothetical protein